MTPHRIAALALAALAAPAAHGQPLERISLPPGFEISVFAEVPGARSLATTEDGSVIFVGTRGDELYSVTDSDGDGAADAVRRRASGLKVPNGVAVADGRLYLGLQDRLVVSEADDALAADGAIRPLGTIWDGMADRGHHGWRYIGAGPEGRLHISLGAPCNICDLTPVTGKILRMEPDGTDVQLLADGVRNSVGFDWHPGTGEFWFTDNGADRMGDDIPPDELNRVTRAGQHFGFPWLGGADVALAGYEGATPPADAQAPEMAFQAHVAALGIDFYEGGMFPAAYRGDAFVAQHGSWNRTVPVGYRVMRVRFDADGNAAGKEVFADGWLGDDGRAWGRPVDIEELPDGSILVSDDHAGLIYRISRAR